MNSQAPNRQSLQRLALQWLSQLDDGLLVVDRDWHVWLWNARLTAIAGLAIQPGSSLSDREGFAEIAATAESWFEQVQRLQQPQGLGWQESTRALEALAGQVRDCFVEFVLYPLVVGDQDLLGIQVRDVSRRLDHSIREQEARLELVQQDRQDALTALDNRAFWETRFGTEFRRSERYDTPFSLLLIEMRPRAGSPSPDALNALRADVAALLRETLRESDMAGRYETDVLVAALPHTAPEEACAVARRLCEAAEAMQVDHREQSLQPALAIGVAHRGEDAASYSELLQKADDALHEARRSGANCYHHGN